MRQAHDSVVMSTTIPRSCAPPRWDWRFGLTSLVHRPSRRYFCAVPPPMCRGCSEDTCGSSSWVGPTTSAGNDARTRSANLGDTAVCSAVHPAGSPRTSMQRKWRQQRPQEQLWSNGWSAVNRQVRTAGGEHGSLPGSPPRHHVLRGAAERPPQAGHQHGITMTGGAATPLDVAATKDIARFP